jgi:chromosome segregation ATPase
MEAQELQDMSMPRLWKMAVNLGVSKKGNKTELVERLLEAREEQDILEGLKQKMTMFEKTKEELKALIESASKLAPRFQEKKKALEQSIGQDQQKIGKIDDLTAKLSGQKEQLQEEAKQRREQISEIDRQIAFLSQTKTLMP